MKGGVGAPRIARVWISWLFFSCVVLVGKRSSYAFVYPTHLSKAACRPGPFTPFVGRFIEELHDDDDDNDEGIDDDYGDDADEEEVFLPMKDLSTIIDNYAGPPVSASSTTSPPLLGVGGVSYFFLRDRLRLEEDDLWHVCWVAGGVLGLTKEALAEKLAHLTDRLGLSDEELRAMVKVRAMQHEHLGCLGILYPDRTHAHTCPSLLCHSAGSAHCALAFQGQRGGHDGITHETA